MGRLPVIAAAVLFSFLAAPGPEGAETGGTVVLTLFWGRGCPHCEQEKAFLQDLRRRYPSLDVREYEVWKNRKNAALYRQVLRAAKITQSGVPGTVVGSTVFLGFNDNTREGIERAVERCLRGGCPDRVAFLAGGTAAAAGAERGELSLPLLGTIDPAGVSLPLFTLVLAGLDSFNPCAFFVLLFLLSLLVHARSRARMLLIGGVFVLFSGLVYFLFMAAWLTMFMVAGRLTAITVAGGVVALIVGAINVKDFFLFRQGMSLSIPESAKPKLFDRMRRLLRAESYPAMLAGAAVLAATANAYELLCTAGFPMVYTRVLTLQRLTTASYLWYLVLYNAVYIVPLAVIVAVMTATLGGRKLTEWQGRKLKLLSGLMMTALGLVLIAAPAALNNIPASIALLAGVLLLWWLTIAAARKIRPERAA